MAAQERPPAVTFNVEDAELGNGAAASGPSEGGAPNDASGAASGAGGRNAASWQKHLLWAMRLSWAVNWLLLGLKIVAYAVSRSKAVLASLADSGVDLASQLVLAIAEHKKDKFHPHYPIGRARLEALAVIACACIMSIASIEVIQYAVTDLIDGTTKGEIPEVDLGPLTFVILGGGTALKLALYVYCQWMASRSESIKALAEDHINDVMSNAGAIVSSVIVRFVPSAWWVDPAAAILISLIILGRWGRITWQQVSKLLGHAAPEEFRSRIEDTARAHHPQLALDKVTAYTFGNRYFAELEILLPPDMTVKESHDIALELQQQVEEDEEVERAFVHIDYARRDKSEHRLDRQRFEEHTRKQEAKEAKRAARAAKRGGGNRREQGDSSGGGSGAGGAAV